MMITKLTQIVDEARKRGRRRLAVAYGQDSHTLTAVYDAYEAGLVEPTVYGDKAVIEEVCRKEGIDASLFKIVDEPNDVECVRLAVAAVVAGDADVLMKGLVSTDKYMRGILNKDAGLFPPKGVLSHVSIFEIPSLPKLLCVSDVAVIPQPTLDQRRAIIDYGVTVCRTFGIEQPRVALLHYSEKVNEKCPLTLDYRELVRRAEAGEWGNTIVDGPIDLRCALDETSERVKGIDSPLGGRADFLHFPDLEAGNLFYKTLPFLCDARVAGMLAGTQCPVVLSSRSDNADDKFLSLAVALFVASHQHT